MQRQVYLDNNATTELHPEVKQTMMEGLEVFGNPSSIHRQGRQAKQQIEKAREKIAQSIGASSSELVFVGSGSEANNTVLHIFSSQRKRILISAIEHPCIFETMKNYQKGGGSCSFIPVDKYGIVDMIALEKALKEKETALVSVMMANNEIGTIQDITAISQMAHEYGACMHTDAVQAFGKIPIDVRSLGVDYLTLSAHKIYGPKGIGALYVKKGVKYSSFIQGGHQEHNKRAGTENVLGILGFAKAVELAHAEIKVNADKYLQLKQLLKEGIEKNIPSVIINGHPTKSLPNTLNVSFKGIEGESILLYLDDEGIYVSTGSACSSANLDPSYVLLSIGLSHELAHGSIRFSIGRENTKEDIAYVLKKLPYVIQKLRHMSTIYAGGRS